VLRAKLWKNCTRMRCQFYHAIALCVLIAPACAKPDSTSPAAKPAAAPARGTATAPVTSAGATPTSEAVSRGKELIEKIRAAAGGPKVTAMRSFEARGTSTTSVIAGARSLTVRALFPGFYRQEEIPAAKGGLGVAIGVGVGNIGWMLGARLGGDGRPTDAKGLQDAYNRAASQAMAGFLAGANAPWMVDSGQFVAVASTTPESGDDSQLIVINLAGPHGRAGRLLVDPSTNLPRRFIEPPQAGTGGGAGRNEINFAYADFRDVDGVKLPHTIVRRVGNIQTTWTIEKYTLNPKLRPRDFSRRVAATMK
jgi:hypothetical protein